MPCRQDRHAAHAKAREPHRGLIDRQLGDADVVALRRQELADHVGVARQEAYEHARPLGEKG